MSILSGAAYCLLFGKYIEVGTVKNRWVVKGSFKRWWQVKTWAKFFDEMLNPRGDDKECLPSLLEWRNRFLDLFWLIFDFQNHSKSVSAAMLIFIYKFCNILTKSCLRDDTSDT